VERRGGSIEAAHYRHDIHFQPHLLNIPIRKRNLTVNTTTAPLRSFIRRWTSLDTLRYIRKTFSLGSRRADSRRYTHNASGHAPKGRLPASTIQTKSACTGITADYVGAGNRCFHSLCMDKICEGGLGATVRRKIPKGHYASQTKRRHQPLIF
jgi:hypothetical protein